MKKYLALFIVCSIGYGCFAQQRNDDYGDLKGGFKQENIFAGGSLSLGFGDHSFGVGANPQIGYTFAQWLDAGIAFNINYNTQNYTYVDPDDGSYYKVKDRQTSYGLGPFVKLYPVNFLFVQGQYEYNWTKLTERYPDASGVPIKFKYKVGAPSFIAAVGYTQRIVGQSSYFVMVGLDLLKRENSPYTGHDYLTGELVSEPIFRTGFNFYLRPSKGAARESRYQSARIL